MNLKKVSVGLVSLSVFLLAATYVMAEDGTNSGTTASPSPRTGLYNFFGTHTPEPTESPEPRETPKPYTLRLDRLNDIRLKVCETHHDEIGKRSQSLGNLVAEMLGKFDGIATSVENFYNNKVVPGGHTVPNYTALVADIAAKRALVVKDLASAEADVAGFTCTGDNPKGQITQYRLDMQKVKTDLQNYRTSIKNLIVAVKSVVGETNSSPEPTESPKPSASPI